MFDTLFTTTVRKTGLADLVVKKLNEHFGVTLKLKAKYAANGWLYLATVNTDRSGKHSGLYVIHSSTAATKGKSIQFKVYQEAECPVSGAMCSQKLLDLTAAFRTNPSFASLSKAYEVSTLVLENTKCEEPVYLFDGDGFNHPSMSNRIVAWRPKKSTVPNRILVIALDAIGDELHLDCDITSMRQHGFVELDPASYEPAFSADDGEPLVTLGSIAFQRTASGLEIAGSTPSKDQLAAYNLERMRAAHRVTIRTPSFQDLFL